MFWGVNYYWRSSLFDRNIRFIFCKKFINYNYNNSYCPNFRFIWNAQKKSKKIIQKKKECLEEDKSENSEKNSKDYMITKERENSVSEIQKGYVEPYGTEIVCHYKDDDKYLEQKKLKNISNPKRKYMSQYDIEQFAKECNAYMVREERKERQEKEQKGQ